MCPDVDGATPLARTAWAAAEPLHTLVYFAPEVRAASEAAGLRGFWRGYFALRAAPLGSVGPSVLTAVLYNFAPAMVARAVPGVWETTTPAEALAARLSGVDRACGRSSATASCSAPAVAEAAMLAREVVGAAPIDGRALGAAVAGLAWPDAPHLALWHGVTALRELRGDGHNAALLAAGLDGCAAHVLFAAVGGSARSLTQPHRGWTDGEWDTRVDDLVARRARRRCRPGHRAGASASAAVESATDRAAVDPAGVLGADRAARLLAVLVDLSGAIVRAGIVPVPNPMGAPWPPP